MSEERMEIVDVQQRWEYRCECFGTLENLENALNRIGDERWELCGLVTHEADVHAVFKRPQKFFAKRWSRADERTERPAHAK